MVYRKLILLVILLVSISSVKTQAQELRCGVTVNYNRIKGANANVFEDMQQAITSFLNDRKWTSDNFDNSERIECNMVIQLDEQVSTGEYSGSITVQSRRPIFDSSYKSTLLNIKDESFSIEYEEFQALNFNETSNSDNLTSVLAFYAYLIIGMDYDSFSPLGGSPYFQKAMQIVNNSQNSKFGGWRSFESTRNRYWIAENFTNRAYNDFRQFTYDYHMKGLDEMTDELTRGRVVIANGLESISKLYRTYPDIYLFPMLFDAKSAEFINIFSGSPQEEASRVVDILNELDPSNTAEYEKITDSAVNF